MINKVIENIKYELVVLIPHFNNPEGLYASLKSIECNTRTYALIIDDGSQSDKKPNLDRIDNLLCNSEIKYSTIFLDRNVGIENALNIGLKEIKEHHHCKYIARVDCGDISVNDRFNKQIHFLENNKKISLCGSWADVILPGGKFLYRLRSPISHEKIKRIMNVRIAFVHPTIMFRFEVLNSIMRYPLGFTTAEDYAFLFRVVKGFRTANIPEVLLHKERSAVSISTSQRKKQVFTRLRIIIKFGSINAYWFYGVARTILLLIVPYSIMEYLKSKVLK